LVSRHTTPLALGHRRPVVFEKETARARKYPRTERKKLEEDPASDKSKRTVGRRPEKGWENLCDWNRRINKVPGAHLGRGRKQGQRLINFAVEACKSYALGGDGNQGKCGRNLGSFRGGREGTTQKAFGGNCIGQRTSTKETAGGPVLTNWVGRKG